MQTIHFIHVLGIRYSQVDNICFAVKWIRENMLEQVESLTSEAGDGYSSDDRASRVKGKKQK